MEIIDLRTGRAYRVNYRKLRITKITDLRAAHKLLVEAYLHISYNQRINLKSFIPYSALANEARGKGNIDFVMTHDAAISLIDSVISKLPVGVPSEELSLFEHNLLNAVCRTLVMANPTLSVQDIGTAPPAIVALVGRIEKNGYRDLVIPLNEIVNIVGKDDVDTEMEIWSGRPHVTIRSKNGVDMVFASAELVSLYYDVSNRPRYLEEDIIDEDYFYDDSESDIADSADDYAPTVVEEGLDYEIPEAPEYLGHNHDFPENLE